MILLLFFALFSARKNEKDSPPAPHKHAALVPMRTLQNFGNDFLKNGNDFLKNLVRDFFPSRHPPFSSSAIPLFPLPAIALFPRPFSKEKAALRLAIGNLFLKRIYAQPLPSLL
ncbi:MAG: hypothetical protein J5552_12885 [Prevotella sp.]|nr:hypothetical protein [Prevotella sp.]